MSKKPINGKLITYRQMDMAVDTLVRNIVQIRSVSEWTSEIGYSRAHFCRKFTNKFGENPKMVLRRARFRKICRVIQSDWSATAYKVALDSGIHNEKSLHKFLSRNFNIGFVTLKDNLKRDAFRARRYLSKASDDTRYYLYDLKRESLPGDTTFPDNTSAG